MGGTISNDISLESTQQIFTAKHSCRLLGEVGYPETTVQKGALALVATQIITFVLHAETRATYVSSSQMD